MNYDNYEPARVVHRPPVLTRAKWSFWTEAEISILHRLYPHQSTVSIAKLLGRGIGSVYQKAATLGISKTVDYLNSADSGRSKPGQSPSPMHRFKKGLVPWNKGTRGVMPSPAPGKGYQPGNVPHTHRPVGSERRDKDGHLVRKVSDTRIKQVDWQLVKNIVWRQHFGEIPPGFFVICKDRQPDNLQPDNLQPDNLAIVNRSDNMRRNSFRNCPTEMAQLYQLKGAINRQVNRINKQNDDTH